MVNRLQNNTEQHLIFCIYYIMESLAYKVKFAVKTCGSSKCGEIWPIVWTFCVDKVQIIRVVLIAIDRYVIIYMCNVTL